METQKDWGRLAGHILAGVLGAFVLGGVAIALLDNNAGSYGQDPLLGNLTEVHDQLVLTEKALSDVKVEWLNLQKQVEVKHAELEALRVQRNELIEQTTVLINSSLPNHTESAEDFQ